MKTKTDISGILTMPALRAAPLLLGLDLIRDLPEGRLRLRIVETEAYHQDDPASHSFTGNTRRTAPMFEAGGRIYVYFTYGMHYCINIVTGKAGVGEAVLLRAAEPLEGIEVMQNNRGMREIRQLTNGPAKLAQALGIKDTGLSGKILNRSSIYIAPGKSIRSKQIGISPRIGITKAADQPWRFYIKGNAFVTKSVHNR